MSRGGSCHRRQTAWLGLLVVCACGPDDKPQFDGLRWDTADITYFSRPGDPTACADALSEIVDHRSAFAQFFDAPAVASTPLRYYKYRGIKDFASAAGCLAEADACFDGAVKSTLPVDYHELSHAWQRAAFAPRARFVSEGLATATSCSPFREDASASTELAAALGDGTELDYHAAARLVSRLLAKSSVADFVRFSRAVDAAADPALGAAAAAADVYGEALSDIWDEAKQEPALPCFALGLCATAPLLAPGASRLETTCTGPTRFLLSSELGPALGLRSVGAWPTVLACSPDSGPYAPRQSGLASPSGADGAEYVFETPREPQLLMLSDRDASLEALMTTRVLPSAFSESCSLDSAIVLQTRSLRILLPERAATLFFPFALGDATANLTFTGSGATLAWCDPCDTCQDLPTGSSLTGTGALRVTLDPASDPRQIELDVN